MIDEKKLEKIYEAVSGNVVLTKQELISYGFKEEELTELVKRGILLENDNDYSLKKTKGLFLYGKKYINDDKDKAVTIFEKCVEINPKDYYAIFQLFLINIQNENYESALKYFDILYENNNNRFYSSNYNLYLYLLNFITSLPDKYINIVKNLKSDDLLVYPWDKRYNNTRIHNNMRISIFNQKFTQAKSQLLNCADKNHFNISEYLINLLLTQAIAIDSEMEQLLSANLTRVYDKGISILKPLTVPETTAIGKMVENTPNLTYFEIEFEQVKRIVLKNKLDPVEKIDMSKLLKLAYQSFRNRDYDDCINNYRKILKNWEKNPKVFIFANLGLAYLEKEDFAIALDYLTVATALNKGLETKYDFSKQISYISKECLEEYEIYDNFMEEFNKPVDQYYGINNISDIIELVSNGINLNEACERLNLTEEQKNIVTLIFAREWYTLGNYQVGDSYLKMVEKTPNKSKFTNSLLTEIRKNKNFYKNRIDDNYQSILVKTKTKIK